MTERTHLIKAFSGYGTYMFPPLIIPGDHFWMEFSQVENEESQIDNAWGYKFYVTPFRMAVSDRVALTQPTFDFAIAMTDWLLRYRFSTLFLIHQLNQFSLTPIWVREFYTAETFDVILSHLSRDPPLHQKIRIFNALARLLQRWYQFARGRALYLLIWTLLCIAYIVLIDTIIGNKPNLGRLARLKEEMFELYHAELQRGDCYHSLYFQNLVELSFHLHIAEERQRAEEGRLIAILGGTSEPLPPPKTSMAWFYSSAKIVKVMKHLMRTEVFSEEFMLDALKHSKKQLIMEESPHPYPNGAKVTSSVCVPKAKYLSITFDQRCRIENGCDYLMFSRHSVGEADIAFFTGEFGSKVLDIEVCLLYSLLLFNILNTNT